MGDEDRVTHYHLPAGSPQIPDELGAITGIDLLSHSVEKIVLARQQSNQGEDVIVMALTFVGDHEATPHVVCSFPLSLGKSIQQSLADLLKDVS